MTDKWLEVLWMVVAVVRVAESALSPVGDNVCLVDEKYVDIIQIRELVPVKVYTVQWCWRIPPRCTIETTSLQPTLVNKEIPRSRIVARCCKGYAEVVTGGRCEPICSEPCLNNGVCIQPDKCSCESGFHGSACEKRCSVGTWGRGCVEKCDCENESTCDGVHGECTCAPGWRGLRCEAPCDRGYYGEDCWRRCNCGGETCNHVTGECTMITTTEELTETTTDDWTTTTTGITVTTEPVDMKIESTTYSTESVTTKVKVEVTTAAKTEVELETQNSEIITESEADNEVYEPEDFDSITVRRQKFNLFALLQNLFIVCGVVVFVFVLSICLVMVRHYRRIRKLVFVCEKPDTKELGVHGFYGGTALPVKTVLDNPVYMAEMDLRMEQPKIMTFKPLPEETKIGGEYFMQSSPFPEDALDNFQEHYYHELDENYREAIKPSSTFR